MPTSPISLPPDPPAAAPSEQVREAAEGRLFKARESRPGAAVSPDHVDGPDGFSVFCYAAHETAEQLNKLFAAIRPPAAALSGNKYVAPEESIPVGVEVHHAAPTEGEEERFNTILRGIVTRMASHTIPAHYEDAWAHFLALLRQVKRSEISTAAAPTEGETPETDAAATAALTALNGDYAFAFGQMHSFARFLERRLREAEQTRDEERIVLLRRARAAEAEARELRSLLDRIGSAYKEACDKGDAFEAAAERAEAEAKGLRERAEVLEFAAKRAIRDLFHAADDVRDAEMRRLFRERAKGFEKAVGNTADYYREFMRRTDKAEMEAERCRAALAAKESGRG